MVIDAAFHAEETNFSLRLTSGRKWPRIPARSGAIAFAISGYGYVGTGVDLSGKLLSDWWSYDSNQNRWQRRQDFPANEAASIQRRNGLGFVINGKGYLSQGGQVKTTWEYNPTDDSWTARGGFEGIDRRDAVGFGIGSKGYVTTGRDNRSTVDDLWMFDPTAIQQ